MDFIHLGRADYEKETRHQESQKSSAYFRKWEEFCRESEIKDKFLSDFSKTQKVEIMCAFLVTIRQSFFGKTSKKTLLEVSVRDTL